MNAYSLALDKPVPRWRRRLAVVLRRSRIMTLIEIGAIVLLVVMLAASYAAIAGTAESENLLTPPLVAMLLVANLVPAMALMVLAARRIAKRRAAQSPIGGRGRLHVRLVALFSAVASVPTLLVVIFASLLFQAGLQFWFSDQARTVLRNAENVSQIYINEGSQRLQLDVASAGDDVVGYINDFGADGTLMGDGLVYQAGMRGLKELAILTVTPDGIVQTQAMVNLDDRPIETRFPARDLMALKAGETRIITDAGDRLEGVIRLDPSAAVFLYASREANAAAIRQFEEARTAASDYQNLLTDARSLQFRFNAILLGVSLLIVAIAIWIALSIADRLVRPVGELVDAARRVTAGDLSARVPRRGDKDEVATLGNAFNRMTTTLEEQTGALVTANSQLDNRRAFIEAVLSGVTAGVISVDRERRVSLINSSAEALLKSGEGRAIGRSLADLAPELDQHLDAGEREDIIQVSSGGDPRTLAVKRVKVENGFVLTFDDITEQVLDQRRAAWSDVARRIAHEIKNPLTPIQLAAERLQRRYGSEIQSDPSTFERLTGTIVRQVGDLRRMVDEFSSFARMPKPVFREEDMVELGRQALFLHEVAHPDIAFTLEAPDAALLVCDRRQLGQALTNVVKNAVEAIQQKREGGGQGPDAVTMRIEVGNGRLCLDVSDTGIGLPVDRGRITEPYMTTRAKGTGLGLAIVSKIVEEHFGTLEFDDTPGGGTRVRMQFDAEALARFGGPGNETGTNQVVNG